MAEMKGDQEKVASGVHGRSEGISRGQ